MTRAPFVAGSETSEAAADSMEDSVLTYERMVFQFIHARAARGATSDECQVALGLTHQNGSARVSTLAMRGAIVRTEEKRKTRSGRGAFVYISKEVAGEMQNKRTQAELPL